MKSTKKMKLKLWFRFHLKIYLLIHTTCIDHTGIILSEFGGQLLAIEGRQDEDRTAIRLDIPVMIDNQKPRSSEIHRHFKGPSRARCEWLRLYHHSHKKRDLPIG